MLNSPTVISTIGEWRCRWFAIRPAGSLQRHVHPDTGVGSSSRDSIQTKQSRDALSLDSSCSTWMTTIWPTTLESFLNHLHGTEVIRATAGPKLAKHEDPPAHWGSHFETRLGGGSPGRGERQQTWRGMQVAAKNFSSVLATDRVCVLSEVFVWALLLRNMSTSQYLKDYSP